MPISRGQRAHGDSRKWDARIAGILGLGRSRNAGERVSMPRAEKRAVAHKVNDGFATEDPTPGTLPAGA
jgi:hypothetical protein